MKKFFKSVLAVLIIGAVTAATVYFTQGGDQSQRGRRWARSEGPVPVVATQAKLADVPVWLEGVGSAKARNLVTVRPQVDGKIMSIDFKEGQEVKKGDLLAQIDPVTYKAQLDQAVAKKAWTRRSSPTPSAISSATPAFRPTSSPPRRSIRSARSSRSSRRRSSPTTRRSRTRAPS